MEAMRVDEVSTEPKNIDERLRKIRQGLEQEVHVPPRLILTKVMESIDSPSLPAFECQAMDGSFKAVVKIDVSTTKSSVEPGILIKEVEGELCANPQLAVASASMEALKYLANRRFVRIDDHSSSVAEHFHDCENWCNVNSVCIGVQEGLESWKSVIEEYEKFELNMETKVSDMNTNSCNTQATIYGDVSSCINGVLKHCGQSYRVLSMEFATLQEARRSYRDEINNFDMKRYNKVGSISEKDILSYVLSYLGFGAATYMSEYAEGECYIGRVTFDVPDVVEAGCGGIMTFRGSMSANTRDAEKYAAYSGLRFLERTLKVKIVDLNYSDQVKARQNHYLVLDLLVSFQALGHKIRKGWKSMKRCLEESCAFHESDYKLMNEKSMCAEDIEALAGCIKAWKEVQDEAASKYEVFAEKMVELNKYYPKSL